MAYQLFSDNAKVRSMGLAPFYTSLIGGRTTYNVTSGVSTGTTAQMILAIVNPSNSLVDLYFERITLSNNSNGTWTRFRNVALTITGATTGLQNRGGGANTPAAVVYTTGSASFTGGMPISTVHVGAYAPETIEEKGALILLPGNNTAWTFTPATGITNYSAALNLVHWETSSL